MLSPETQRKIFMAAYHAAMRGQSFTEKAHQQRAAQLTKEMLDRIEAKPPKK